MGFFAADGYISHNKRGGNFWCFQIADKDLLEEIKATIKSDHKISVRRGNKDSLLYRLQIGRKEMCEDLRKLGMDNQKTKRMNLPSIPEKYTSDFVKGYFDGDGNVWYGLVNVKRKKPTRALSVAFTSANHRFLTNFLQLLQGQGVKKGSLFRIRDKDCYRIVFSALDSLKLYEIMYNGPCHLYLRRKRVIFDKFIEDRNAPVV